MNCRTRTKETCGGVFIYLFSIEFGGVILHIKSINVSSVQFYQTLLVYSIVFSLSKVNSFSINNYSFHILPHFLAWPSYICLCLWGFHLSIFFIVYEGLSDPSLLTSVSLYLLSMMLLYFVCLFCSLYYTYKWIHVVFFFLWLAYFTYFT